MFIVKRGFVRLCDYFLRGNSDQYPVPYRKRHKRKYLELIYAFIANIVPHARLYPEMPVLPSASMKLDSAYWYFLLPFYDPPFLTIRRPRKSGNLETFIGCQVSRVFRNDRERFVAYLLFHTCPLLRSKVKKKKKKRNDPVHSLFHLRPILFNQGLCQRDDLKIILNWTTRDGGRKEKDIFV